ncbi:STAS domain-containing protein [Jatrophihabitans telluris]|uniref:Anti-sigma factor antagonist n=1 Tax=Jatrophihabitans telluris TaxID=2038343 RepID=A0ABY4QXS8_9ACTN|nr:STAS domain-containing protein [Jatrophihabitans telluris]UQX88138.1 STAS domain-containing protein [Jatrophihabitans telluris]
MDLSLNQSTVDAHPVVDVRGEVDVHTASHLRDRLTQVIDSTDAPVVVDLSSLGFIDSTGLGALVAARNHSEERGSALLLVCNSDRLLKLFRITGLHEVFSIHDSVPAAIASAPSQTPASS